MFLRLEADFFCLFCKQFKYRNMSSKDMKVLSKNDMLTKVWTLRIALIISCLNPGGCDGKQPSHLLSIRKKIS